MCRSENGIERTAHPSNMWTGSILWVILAHASTIMRGNPLWVYIMIAVDSLGLNYLISFVSADFSLRNNRSNPVQCFISGWGTSLQGGSMSSTEGSHPTTESFLKTWAKPGQACPLTRGCWICCKPWKGGGLPWWYPEEYAPLKNEGG